MIDTDKYTGHIENIGRWQMFANTLPRWAEDADRKLVQDAPLLLAEVKRLRGLLDEIDDVVYYNDKKAGQVLPVEKPNLELLRDIIMSYTDEAYQVRGDEGEWIE